MSYKEFLEQNISKEVQDLTKTSLSEDNYNKVQEVLDYICDDFRSEISQQTIGVANDLTETYAYDMTNVIEQENSKEYEYLKNEISNSLKEIYDSLNSKDAPSTSNLNNFIENISLPENELRYAELGISSPKYEEIKNNIIAFGEVCEKKSYDIKKELEGINSSVYKNYDKNYERDNYKDYEDLSL